MITSPESPTWLIKEHTLNHTRDPHVIQGMFLGQAILGSLGVLRSHIRTPALALDTSNTGLYSKVNPYRPVVWALIELRNPHIHMIADSTTRTQLQNRGPSSLDS